MSYSSQKHRERWMKRIKKAELKAEIIENGLHDVLNYIEDEDLDETIHAKLMEVVNSY